MLELGAYWGHYSMWLKKYRPEALVHLIEPDKRRLLTGKHNFQINGFDGVFVKAFVAKNKFIVDQYLAENNFTKLDILHSDIQGYELEMLQGCEQSLQAKLINYIFISTHSQNLHEEVERLFKNYNYRIEVSADFEIGTTSFDGFIFASNNLVNPVFTSFTPLTRIQIEEAEPEFLFDYLSKITAMTKRISVDQSLI